MSLSLYMSPWLGDRAVKHLGALGNLEHLHVTATDMTEEGVERLRELLPDTSIVHDEFHLEEQLAEWLAGVAAISRERPTDC